MTYWEAEEFLGGNNVYALYCKGKDYIHQQWLVATRRGETKKADALMTLLRQYRTAIMPNGTIVIKLVRPIPEHLM